LKYLQLFIVISIVSILCTGCAQRAIENHSNRNDTNFNSTLWMQSSSEFKASSLQTYNTATGNLEKIVKTTTETAAIEQTAPYASLPSAVIMDIDETVLDNSRYEANLILTADSYSSTTWDDWIALQQATAIPGAVHFINYARSIGVEVIFITNRSCKEREGNVDTCPQQSDTMNNLEKVGIVDVHPSNLLLREEQDGWTSEKTSRREIVAKNYRIVMLFGDDLGDFLQNVKKDITPDQRERLVNAHSEKWGSVWYILPNPKYGSWLRILENPKSQYLEGY
jgi:5'-nucleotidase (lipoprotein e(P4) family)